MRSKFLNYVIPSVLAMWIYSFYTMVNGIFVANCAGEIALAAVNIVMPYINIIFAVAILFAVGTSTAASINLANKKIKEAGEIFTMNTAILILIGITAMVTVLFNLEGISYLLGATENTIVYVKEYLSIVSFFSIFTMLSYYFEVLVKTEGSPRLATYVVCISAVVNMVSVYIFVVKLGYGIKGAALASGLSQVSACIVYILHFIKRESKIKFVPFKMDLLSVFRTVKLGSPDFITEFSTGFITYIFNRTILINIGEIGIITYTIIMYVNTIVLMTITGISQGVQPLISYYYGRDDKKTYIYFFKTAFKTVIIYAFIIYAVCILFAEQINGIFISREKTVLFQYSVKAFKTYVSAYLMVGFNIAFIGFFTAIEKPVFSMIISMGRGLVVIAASLFVMTSLMGSKGIWIAPFISEAAVLVIAFVIFVKFYLNDLYEESNIAETCD